MIHGKRPMNHATLWFDSFLKTGRLMLSGDGPPRRPEAMADAREAEL